MGVGVGTVVKTTIVLHNEDGSKRPTSTDEDSFAVPSRWG